MAWEPIHKQRDEDAAWKTLVSRGAALALGLALLFASYKLASTATAISADISERGLDTGRRGRRAHAGGTGIFWVGATVTGLAGLGIAGIGLLPVSVMERFVGES